MRGVAEARGGGRGAAGVEVGEHEVLEERRGGGAMAAAAAPTPPAPTMRMRIAATLPAAPARPRPRSDVLGSRHGHRHRRRPRARSPCSLERKLAEAGHRSRAIIRNPAHAADVEAAGAEPVDLRHRGARRPTSRARSPARTRWSSPPAPGPAAGPSASAPSTSAARVALINAAGEAGVTRYVMVSSIGADDPGRATGDMGPYLQAKADADAR